MSSRMRDGDIRPKAPVYKTPPRLENNNNGSVFRRSLIAGAVIFRNISMAVTSWNVRLPKKAWAAFGLVIVGLGASGAILSMSSTKPALVRTEALEVKPEIKPEFKAAMPAEAKSPTDLKYDADKKVINYADKIDGVAITVSQQQLPAGFKENPAESVRKLAEQFSANDKLTVGEYTIYVGTSEKGPQSVVTYKGNLLIFLTSQSKISNTSWGDYISKLK